jgi:hypothetical protein
MLINLFAEDVRSDDAREMKILRYVRYPLVRDQGLNKMALKGRQADPCCKRMSIRLSLFNFQKRKFLALKSQLDQSCASSCALCF